MEIFQFTEAASVLRLAWTPMSVTSKTTLFIVLCFIYQHLNRIRKHGPPENAGAIFGAPIVGWQFSTAQTGVIDGFQGARAMQKPLNFGADAPFCLSYKRCSTAGASAIN